VHVASSPPAPANPEYDIRKPNLRKHMLAILVLGIIVYYLFDSATDEEILDFSQLLGLSEQEYDYFMGDVDSIHYTREGRADYRFRASRVTHYPNPEYSIIESPRLVIYREDDSAWRINSASGRIDVEASSNRERLVLTENVIISGFTAAGRPVNIYTDSLTLYPAEKSISTDSEVMLESEGFYSTSQGLTADLVSDVIRQLAGGYMRYEQPGQRQ
jgi:LPS export ABC transporter protein LptC